MVKNLNYFQGLAQEKSIPNYSREEIIVTLNKKTMNVENFLSNLFKEIWNWITVAEKALAPTITIAENLLNALKKFDDSVIGQTVEGIIEQYIPASTGLINAFKLQLPVWLIDLKWVENEAGKTLEQQWQDALNYLNTIQDPKVKATQLSALKALFLHFFGTNTGTLINGKELTIQQMIVLAPPSHDASIVS